MWKKFINISYTDTIKSCYIKAYKEIYNTYKIQTINITIHQKWVQKDLASYLTQIYKKTYKEVIDFLRNECKNDDIYINTFEESITSDIHYIKKELGQSYTKNYVLFTDKSIERAVAQKNQKNTIIPKYKSGALENIITQEEMMYPYIIKPTHGVQSAWVALIRSEKDIQEYKEKQQKLEQRMQKKWLETNHYIIEEYVDGPMFTMTYFVDNNGNITLYWYDKVETLYDLGINDFSLFARIIEPLSEEIKKKTQKIAKETVNIFTIRNVFIYQDIKIDSNGEAKIIEINGRIWWFRLEMYDYAYGINLLKYIVPSYQPIPQKTKNIIAISLRPIKNNIKRTWINKNIWSKIESLSSYKKSKILKHKLNTIIWFAKYWHTRVWSMILEHNDHKQLMQDYTTIKNIYKDILLYTN